MLRVSPRTRASPFTAMASFCYTIMKEYARSFYKSQTWKDCRAAYAKQRHGLCEVCLAKGIYKPGEIVHHKVHISPENITDPTVTLCFDNLQLVCRDCHADLHKGMVTRFKVDQLGRIVTI